MIQLSIKIGHKHITMVRLSDKIYKIHNIQKIQSNKKAGYYFIWRAKNKWYGYCNKHNKQHHIVMQLIS